jgi:3-oxoacyl-[acyl-carrier protein] reductase
MQREEGKVAIVTGASRGIGRAVAERLGRNGAAVVVNYHKNKEAAEEVVDAITTDGGHAIAVRGDVGVPADVRALFETAGSEFGGVDIVVNNAALAIGGPLEDMPEEDFDRLVAVNLKGVFVSSQEAARNLRDGGRVINVATGLQADAVAFLGVYGATKAGVEVLTRSLAHRLGPRGITVNAVAPGVTDTDMLVSEVRATLDATIEQTPLRRIGQPADLADVVAFLASEAARWVTGQTIHANGGFE